MSTTTPAGELAGGEAMRRLERSALARDRAARPQRSWRRWRRGIRAGRRRRAGPDGAAPSLPKRARGWTGPADPVPQRMVGLRAVLAGGADRAAGADDRVVRVDNRGTGWSRRCARPFTIADLAGDARRVLDASPLDRAVVVGLSMGGMVAQELALRHPSRRPPRAGRHPAADARVHVTQGRRDRPVDGRAGAGPVAAPVHARALGRRHGPRLLRRPPGGDPGDRPLDRRAADAAGRGARPGPGHRRLARRPPVAATRRAGDRRPRRARPADPGAQRDAPCPAHPRRPLRRAARRRPPRTLRGPGRDARRDRRRDR